MDCDQAIELLPWLLNRTLSPEERHAVEGHLGDCERCRAALADTRSAWEVFAQHVPAADLVAYAADEPTAVDGDTLERHLAGCPECAAELEMARSSRALAENEAVAVMPAARGGQGRLRLWRSSALAAGLVGVISIAGWMNSAQEVARLADERRGPAAAAGVTAPSRIRPVPAAVAEGARIALNPAIVTLEAENEATIVRGAGAAVGTQTLPANAELTVFLLRPSERDTAKRHYAELIDSADRVHPLGAGLVQDADGFYTLGLPRQLFTPGPNVIRIYATDGGRRELVASYVFRV
jgi:anti-sigma factor RsiW